MATLSCGQTIQAARWRLQIQQLDVDYTHLSYIENNHRMPTIKALDNIMDDIDIESTPFLFPYLHSNLPVVFTLREEILHAFNLLDDEPQRYEEAKTLYTQLNHLLNRENEVNEQFLLSCEARLLEAKGHAAGKIIAKIKRGMKITFSDFNIKAIKCSLLIYEEANLLHTLARVWAKSNQTDDAIKLLFKIKKGLDGLPIDNVVKEKKATEVLLTLCNLLMQTHDYTQALQLCDEGIALSISQNKGRATPHFLYNKAICLRRKQETKDCPPLLRQAYFACCLMGMKDRAQQIYEAAKTHFNITINTYGTENLTYPTTIKPPMRHGGAEKSEGIGGLLRQFQEEAGITAKEVYKGICTPSIYTRIQNNETQQPSFYVLEGLFQRLGRDINKYCNFLLIKHEFDEKQTRDRIRTLLVHRKYDEAEALLTNLAKSKRYQKGITLQFIRSNRATLHMIRNGRTPEYEKMLHQALAITMPHYDEKKLAHQRLTLEEFNLINKLAINYASKKELPRSIQIFAHLRASLDRFYLDSSEMVRMYALLLYNYSKHLGLAKQYKLAMEMIDEGEWYCKYYERIHHMPGFAINKACDLLELGHVEESKPFFAMAYYGVAMLKDVGEMKKFYDYTKDKLGISFD